MSVDLTVPGGTGTRPGFTVEKTNDAILIYCGALQDGDSMFGITNDEGGLSISAYPVPRRATAVVRATAHLDQARSDWRMISTLRGPITLEQLEDGEVVRTVCTMLDFVWRFSGSFPYPLYDFPYNVPSSGSGFMTEGYPGFGELLPGDYRMTVFWYYYTLHLYESHNALQTFNFTIEPDAADYSFVFQKHDAPDAPEWGEW